jgi:hypothetical protein
MISVYQAIHLWNAWRELEPKTRPELSGADLHGTALFKVDLQGASLEHSDISRALIVDSDLSGANLASVNFRRTRASCSWDQSYTNRTHWLQSVVQEVPCAFPKRSSRFS